MGSSMIPVTLERFLGMTAEREQVVAGNMANVDTPGYHAKDVSFAQTLLRAAGAGDDSTYGTNADTSLPVVVRDEQGLMDRPDGNNVDLDREGLLLAKAQLQYGMGVQDQFHEILSAINGGGQ
jgi:flagellar basal-body rod protein FlgB